MPFAGPADARGKRSDGRSFRRPPAHVFYRPSVIRTAVRLAVLALAFPCGNYGSTAAELRRNAIAGASVLAVLMLGEIEARP
jgi:hypothetical protein